MIGSSNQNGSNSSSARKIRLAVGRSQSVQFDHDVHAIADRAADLAKRLQRLIEFLGADVVAAPALGREVERPDLHAGDALLEQAVRQLVGPVQERIEILVGASACPAGKPQLAVS